METEQDSCPICGSKITEKIIDYSDWSNGHLLVVRDVPVRECQLGHRFFQVRVARALERIFDRANKNQLSPVEVMEVPVVRLDLAA
jgi:YgiT-type zinc finger domain-containing protein